MIKNYTHTDYANIYSDYRSVDDVLQGSTRVKECGARYLTPELAMYQPVLDPEIGSATTWNLDSERFNKYLAEATFYEVPSHTLQTLLGMALRNPPSAEVPDVLEPMKDGLTGRGYSLEILARMLLRAHISKGRFGLLADGPERSTAADPPHAVVYRPEAIDEWDVEYLPGESVLASVKLREDINERDPGESARYLKLKLQDGIYMVEGRTVRGEQELVEDESTPQFVGGSLDFVPFIMIGKDGQDYTPESPQFMGMVNLALKHYKLDAEAIYKAKWVGTGMTLYPGAEPGDLPKVVAPGAQHALPESVTPVPLSASRDGSDLMRDMQRDVEERMEAFGADLRGSGLNTAETAEAVRTRMQARMATLTHSVAVVEAAIEQHYRQCAVMMGANPDEVTVTMSRDFVDTKLSPAEQSSLLAGWKDDLYGARNSEAAISVLYERLREGELLPASISLDDFLAAHAESGNDDTHTDETE